MKPLFASLLLTLATVTGCAAVPADNIPARPSSQYDAVVLAAKTGTPLAVQELARQLADTDIVVIGEYHGHHASHLLQARLQQALYRQNPAQILSMEQFNLDHQADVDAYLAGTTGETEMLEDANAWDNYKASYRPLVEFARQHQLPVIAANAPTDTVRCVGREGEAYLDRLPEAQRSALPQQAFLDTPEYRDKFIDAISGSHGTEQAELSGRMLNTYQAQLLRDNTMAHRMVEALRNRPGHQLVHTTGTFHSEQRLGTVAVLEQRAPELDITVISPVEWPATEADMPLAEHRHKGDYLYFIQPMPREFRGPEREREAMQARFGQRTTTSCD